MSSEDGKIVLPEDAMVRIHKNNIEYCDHTPQTEFDAVQKGQWPWIGVVDCSDSRVTINSIVGTKGRMGQAFNYSCAGTLVDAGRGSIEYAVDHLGIKLLLIEGHTECGMVKAALSDTSGERPSLHRDARAVKARIDSITDIKQISLLDDLTQNVLKNLLAQSCEVASWFKTEVDAGDLVVIGSMYDLHNKLGGGFGHQYVYSINGETDFDIMMNHPVMSKMAEDKRAKMFVPYWTTVKGGNATTISAEVDPSMIDKLNNLDGSDQPVK